MGKADWVVARNDLAFECRHCGEVQAMASPINMDMYIAASKPFLRRHSKCRPAKKEARP